MARPLPRHEARTATAIRPATRLLVTLVSVVALTSALAGCTADRDGTDDDDDHDGSFVQIEFEGESGGTDNDTAECNTDGTITASAIIDNGTVDISVTDGAGETIFNVTLSPVFSGETENLSGEAGTWTLKGERSDDFDGSYIADMGC